MPLSQLAHDPFDASPTKPKLVYTPRTAPPPSIFDDLGRRHLARPSPTEMISPVRASTVWLRQGFHAPNVVAHIVPLNLPATGE